MYGVESKNYKLQIPILILISAFVRVIKNREINIFDDQICDKVITTIKVSLSNSYLEEDFKGSNTRHSILQETLDKMIEVFEKIQ